MRYCCTVGLIIVIAWRGATAAEPAAAEDRRLRPEFAMYHDPEFPRPTIERRLNPNLVSLWREALARPEADMQRLAAQALAESGRDGFLGLDECQADLLEVATADDTHPMARFAAADALIVLEARPTAAALFEISRSGGMPLRMIVEPALARWDFEPVRAVWRARLGDADAGRRDLLLAIEGLGRVRDPQSLPGLMEIVRSITRRPDIRLAAAQSAGEITESGLESDAAQLAGPGPRSLVDRLCAAALLVRHRSEAAAGHLTLLAEDPDPVVTEQALGLLFGIDPELVIPLAEAAMSNADPQVRRRGADAYIALPTPERIHSLSRLLDDPHPDLRADVCAALYRHASQPDLNDAVRLAAVNMLSGTAWRGQEQAALLLGALDHEPAAERLLELLDAERAEVMAAAAWALRKLSIPETLPAMLEQAQEQTIKRRNGQGRDGLDLQVAHLFEAFGLMNYAPAEPLLREFIPKQLINGYYSRGAAIWALGLLHAGVPDESLASQFAERMNDVVAIPPDVSETDVVWRMSALSLGRMRAESQLPALRERLEMTGIHDPVAYAVRWSLHEITGEESPPLPPIVQARSGWFLESLDEAEPPADGP
jgi:HEAT repeat protein